MEYKRIVPDSAGIIPEKKVTFDSVNTLTLEDLRQHESLLERFKLMRKLNRADDVGVINNIEIIDAKDNAHLLYVKVQVYD